MNKYVKDLHLDLEQNFKAPSNLWDLGDQSPESYWDQSDDLLIQKRIKIRFELKTQLDKEITASVPTTERNIIVINDNAQTEKEVERLQRELELAAKDA